jgi:hypothetical protein
VLVVAILLLPLLPASQQGAKTGWNPIPHYGDLLHLFVTISGDNRVYLVAIALCCLAGLLVVAGAYMLKLLGRDRVYGYAGRDASRMLTETTQPREGVGQLQRLVPVVWSLVCWLLVPLMLSYVVSHGTLRIFSSRYLVAIVPPLFLLVGLGVFVLRRRVLQGALALVLILLSLSTVPLYYGSAQVEDWDASLWLIARYQPGDGIVCYDNAVEQGCQISVEYYMHAYPSAAHFTPDSPGAFSWTNFGLANAASSFDAATDPTVLAAYGARHPRVFYVVGRLPDDAAAAKARVAQQWLDRHYRLVGLINTRTVTIRLYATGAPV